MMVFGNKAVQSRIAEAVKIIDKMTADDFTGHIETSGSDVVVPLMRALKKNQETLERRTLEGRRAGDMAGEQLAQLHRMQTALETVSTCVMIADKDLNIVYMNPAVTRMMRNAEADLRKVFPSFDANRLIGANIDQFHKNPAHQRRMLSESTSTHKAQISIGVRSFGLTANPVLDDKGQRLGAVVEWLDITAEKMFEKQIQEVIKGAVEGNFSVRVRADEAMPDGVLKRIGEGINLILEALIAPLTVTTKYIENISRGNIPTKITDDYKGDFNVLKKNMNATIGILNGFIDSIHYVSTEQDKGDIDVMIDTSRFEGAYKIMAQGVNDMVNGHIAVLKNAMACIKAFGEGDFEAPLETFPGKKVFINNTIEQVRANLKALMADTSTLSRAAVEGKLATRANATRHQGDFRKIVEGVNDTLDAVIGPLNVAAKYINDISKGNIPPKITDSYNGDFNTIKNNLNACIEAVSTLVFETGVVIKAARDGQLGTHANDERSEGVYRKILRGVNDALDAVVGPLNVAAKHIDDISKGNIPAKITDNYNGDFNTIKNNLNTCIDAVNALVADTGMLSQAALEGRIQTRADASKHQGDFRRIVEGVNATLETIVTPIIVVKTAVDSISTAAKEISAGNADLSQRTEQQAASLEETASSMEELASTVKQNADNARQANQMAVAASDVAVKGGSVVQQVVKTMSAINESARKIVDIISVIDGIALQTNILALNAAVEAARAGEQGRGFAVVASEVRNLAQRSAAAAKEIKALIGDSVEKVEDGSKLVGEAGKTMDEIVTSVRRVTDIMSEIAAASAEQSSGIGQVNQAITQMDEVTQQNAALVEQAAAAAESLEEQADTLTQAVAQFRLDSGERSAVVPRHDAASLPVVANKPAACSVASAVKPRKSEATAAKPSQQNDDEWTEF